MYYNWNDGNSNDVEWTRHDEVMITDAKTGEKIERVLWCDTEVGVLCRYLMRDGDVYVYRLEVCRVTEFRDFVITFPNREKQKP